MTMTKRVFSLMLATLLGVLGTWAAECFSRGVAYTILDDGSGNIVQGAGEVFVSLTADAAPVWTADTYTSEVAVNEGNATSGSVKQTFYFWAKAKEGYRFVGWNTSKTGKTAASGSNVEGAPFAKTYTHWSAGTEEAPKEQVMYAIFEKLTNDTAEPEDKGDGVQMTSVEDNSYVSGTTTKNFAVKVFFAEGLKFQNLSTAQDGYGLNKDAVAFVTCKDAQGNNVKPVDVRVGGSWDGASTYGRIELPYTIAQGEYTLHLPYGLFLTETDKVTAPCNINVSVTEDNSGLTLVSISPEDGSTWNCDPESEDTNGESIMITLTFDKVITDVDKNAAVTLINEGGRNFGYESISKSLINSKAGLISYGKLPNGTYTVSIPANVFIGANGQGNEAQTLTFTIEGSQADEWALPHYTTVSATPGNNSQLRSLTEIAVTLSREGYGDPIGLINSAGKITVSKLIESYPADADPENPEILPTITSEEITGFTAGVKNGKIVITFAPAFTDKAKVLVNIPAGIVNNIAAPIATMTPQEIFEEGGCTNPEIKLTYYVEPVPMKVKRVTNQGTLDHWDETTYEAVYQYVDLDGAGLSVNGSGDFGSEDVSYVYFWYSENFVPSSLNREKLLAEAYIKNTSTGQTLSLNRYTCGLKNAGDSNRNNVIQLALSFDDYLNNEHAQGEYEVYLPSGIAMTADGMENEGKTIHFTYGDPSQAGKDNDTDLSAFVGNYEIYTVEGEILEGDNDTFSIVESEGKYYLTAIDNNPLLIPVTARGDHHIAKFTETEDYLFCSVTGGDTDMLFAVQDGTNYIFLDECVLQNLSTSSYTTHGGQYYVQVKENGISSISADSTSSAIYNINGQRVNANHKGIVIVNGKKVVR